MTTPINRIPLEDKTIGQCVNAEINTDLLIQSISQEMLSLLAHDQKSDSLSCCMDWAMQIRDAGYDWGTAIRIASILYYG